MVLVKPEMRKRPFAVDTVCGVAQGAVLEGERLGVVLRLEHLALLNTNSLSIGLGTASDGGA